MSAWLLRNQFTLETPLAPGESLNRLRTWVWTPRDDEAEDTTNDDQFMEEPRFVGEMEEGGFRVVRLAGHETVFRPSIRGQVAATASGSSVRVDLAVNPAGCGCLTVWLALTTGMPLFSLLRMDQDRIALVWSMLFLVLTPLLMWVPVYLIAVGTVWYETRKTQAVLRELLIPPPARGD